MYEGMSYVKLYKNKSCTKELDIVDGIYVFDFGLITNNAHNPFTFNIWAKNVGTHTAYSVNVFTSQGTSTVTDTIYPTQVSKVKIQLPIEGQFIGVKSININLEYDSV